MPISLITNKGDEQATQPLLLATMTFIDYGGVAATVSISGGGIVTPVITNGGSGYTTPPQISVVGDGQGARAHATISGGAVNSIIIDAAGNNYTFAILVFGDTLRLASLPLNAAEGSIQYNGNDYFGRILQEDLQPMQWMGEQGIDRIPQVSMKIADSDKFVWTTYEMAPGYGIKGATLQLDLILYDVYNQVFSSDIDTKFVGICEAPDCDTDSITITAVARTNTQTTMLPPVRIQTRCPWNFPQNAAARADSENDWSQFFECGYHPENSNGVNNPGTGQPWTFCDFTRSGAAGCSAHGLFQINVKGRFGGITYTPPSNWRGKSYLQNKTVEGTNTVNDAKWGESYPMIYGTAWVQPPVMFSNGNANNSNFEVVLCSGRLFSSGHTTDPGSVRKVIVNDEEVPFVAYSPDKHNFWWSWITMGQRDGTPNAGYAGDDPYGSLAAITINMPVQAADSGQVPNVQVLLDGPRINAYYAITSITVTGGVAVATYTGSQDLISAQIQASDYRFTIENSSNAALNGNWGPITSWSTNTFTFSTPGVSNGTYTSGFARLRIWTDNPVWVLLDILTWANVRYQDIDRQSFINAATWCDTQISYEDQNGSVVNTDSVSLSESVPSSYTQHRRYRTSMVIRDRTSAADIITGLRNSFNGVLTWVSGFLHLDIERSAPDSQPSAISGSNSSTPISGVNFAGSVTNWYPAYVFGPGDIARDDQGRSTLRITRTKNSNAPNKLEFGFQDRLNLWQQDTISEVEPDDINRISSEFDQNYSCLGCNTFDQAMRLCATQFARIHRGNPGGDTRGTMTFELETTFRVEHLLTGQICALTDAQNGFSTQPIRIRSIRPSMNYEHLIITATWHDDRWYMDSFGQTGGYGASNLQRSTNRLPYPWKPGAATLSSAGDAAFPPYYQTFGLTENTGVDTNGNTVMTHAVSGYYPVNQFNLPMKTPLVLLQGAQGTGGSLPDGNYWAVICGTDRDPTVGGNVLSGVGANINLTAPSQTVSTAVAGGGGSATVVVSTVSWDSSNAGWVAFAGTDPRDLTCVGWGSGSPTSVTISSLNFSVPLPPPDVLANNIRVKIAPILAEGVEYAIVVSQSSGVITVTPGFTAGGWTSNLWQNRVVTLYRKATGGTLPLWNRQISASSVVSGGSATLTVSGTTSTLAAGDLLIIRAMPTLAFNSANTLFTDSAWAFNPGVNFGPRNLAGFTMLIVGGKGRGLSQTILSNTSTTVTTSPFDSSQLDSTSIPLIVYPTYLKIYDGAQIVGSQFEQGLLASVSCDVTIFANNGVVLKAVVVDSDGYESYDTLAAIRETFVPVIGTGGQLLPISFLFDTPVVGVATNSLELPYTASPVSVSITAVNPSPTGATTFDIQTSPDQLTWISILQGGAITLPVSTLSVSLTSSAFLLGATLAKGSFIRSIVNSGSATDAQQVVVQMQLTIPGM